MPVIDLVPETIDLILYAGDGATFKVTVLDSTGQPVFLSGIVKAQVRKTSQDVDAQDFGINDDDFNVGVVYISLTSAQTQALINGSTKYKGVWDVQWTAPAADTITLVRGNIEVVADVTR